MNKFYLSKVEYSSEYSESKFWNKLKAKARDIGREAVFNALQLYYLMTDGEVPFTIKMEILGALGYLILPVDAIPDFIPIVGYTDDAGAILFVLKQVSSYITPKIRQKARAAADKLF